MEDSLNKAPLKQSGADKESFKDYAPADTPALALESRWP
jgi:hypothetical protein